jgi:cell division protein FtsB
MARSRGLRRMLRLRWIALVALGLVALLYYKPVRSYLDTRADVDARAAEVRKLRVQKRALERRMTEVASGEQLLRQARRLGLVKPGERLFIVKGIGAWRAASRKK